MKTISNIFFDNNFLLFLSANTTAAIINFGSRIVLGDFMSYGWSIVIAYLIGMTVAYLLCRLFIFQSEKNKTHQEIVYFIVVNMTGIFIALGVSQFLFHIGLTMIHDVFLREEVAHFMGICAPAFASYIGHKYITFR